MAHAEESARYKKEPLAESALCVYFSKRVSEATGTGAEIPSHKELVQDLDYEAELGGYYWKGRKKCACLRGEKLYFRLYGDQ